MDPHSRAEHVQACMWEEHMDTGRKGTGARPIWIDADAPCGPSPALIPLSAASSCFVFNSTRHTLAAQSTLGRPGADRPRKNKREHPVAEQRTVAEQARVIKQLEIKLVPTVSPWPGSTRDLPHHGGSPGGQCPAPRPGLRRPRGCGCVSARGGGAKDGRAIINRATACVRE